MFQRLFTLTVALLLTAGVAGCEPGKGSEVDDVAPEVRFEDLRFEVYRGVALEATGTVRAARMRRDTSALGAEQIQVKFPAEADRPPALLTAASGVGNAAERWFELQGGVRAKQGDDLVETERARLDGNDRLVRGDAEVTVSGPGYALRGPGFVLDPDARTVRVEGGARLRAAGAAPGGASR